MRVPGSIEGTDKVYAATWAAHLAIQTHNRAAGRMIAVVGLPSLGTGFGGVPFDEAARGHRPDNSNLGDGIAMSKVGCGATLETALGHGLRAALRCPRLPTARLKIRKANRRMA